MPGDDQLNGSDHDVAAAARDLVLKKRAMHRACAEQVEKGWEHAWDSASAYADAFENLERLIGGADATG